MRPSLIALLIVVARGIFAEDVVPTGTGPLMAVIDRRTDVLASDGEHLFRASRLGFEHSPWKVVPTPPEMGLFGAFALPPEGAGREAKQPGHRVIFYTLRENDVAAAGEDAARKYGVFVSEDDGNHWKLANDQWNFNKVTVLPDGAMYALAEPLGSEKQPAPAEGKSERKARVLRSVDTGATWADVTGNAVELLDADDASDPDDFLAADGPPVCVHGFSTRGYYALLPTDAEGVWKRYPAPVWDAVHATPERFCAPFTYGFDFKDRTSGPMLATFEDYFKFRFVNRTSIEAFAVIPEREAYEFNWHQPMPVKVAVEFRKKDKTLTLLDLGNSSDLWGARVVTPKGKRVKIPSAAMRKGGDPKNKDATRALLTEYLANPELRRIDLTRGHPYAREVDLNQCIPFPEPGTYKV